MLYKRIILAVILMGVLAWLADKFFSSPAGTVSGSIYDFSVKGLDGATVDFDQYRGKNLLIVNTASKCGYTPQYETLQQLHEKYGDRITVLGFPANNFLCQEPGSNSEIAEFCQKNYGVGFQIFEKISVRGSDQHPLYQWLAAKAGKRPTWNFCKYFVNSRGEVTGFYGPKVSPLDQSILKQIAN
jgi:glutathione peroxidase